jgi:hypothetical protein
MSMLAEADADADAAGWDPDAGADGEAAVDVEGDAVAAPPLEQADKARANATRGVNVRNNARFVINVVSPKLRWVSLMSARSGRPSRDPTPPTVIAVVLSAAGVTWPLSGSSR